MSTLPALLTAACALLVGSNSSCTCTATLPVPLIEGAQNLASVSCEPVVHFAWSNSFEAPVLASGGYNYGPPLNRPAQPWLFQPWLGFSSGNEGLAAHYSPFDPPNNPSPPNGNQYAVLQPSSGSPQTINTTLPSPGLVAGSTYNLGFFTAGRAGNPTTPIALTVLVGSEVLYSDAEQVIGGEDWTYESVKVVPQVGGTQLSIIASPAAVGDQSLLLDYVSITEV